MENQQIPNPWNEYTYQYRRRHPEKVRRWEVKSGLGRIARYAVENPEDAAAVIREYAAAHPAEIAALRKKVHGE